MGLGLWILKWRKNEISVLSHSWVSKHIVNNQHLSLYIKSWHFQGISFFLHTHASFSFVCSCCFAVVVVGDAICDVLRDEFSLFLVLFLQMFVWCPVFIHASKYHCFYSSFSFFILCLSYSLHCFVVVCISNFFCKG